MPSISFADLSSMGADQLTTVLSQEPEVAARWLAAAAKYGIVEAQTAYAQLLLDGRGVARDPKEAFAWFSVAAGAGSLEAINMVGRCLELGWGVPAHPGAAAGHFRRAAEKDYDWAQYNLANLLARGVGVPRDPEEAFAWYARAARQGHAKSMNLVGRFLEEGWAGRADPGAALDWYRRAAEGGDFRGQFNYGMELANRGQVEAALGWLRRAAATGTPGFLRSMAKALGPHPEFRSVALQALARCCDGGGAEDFFAYGRALSEEPGADPARARHWLRLARTAGHPEAGPLLRRLVRAERSRWRLPLGRAAATGFGSWVRGLRLGAWSGAHRCIAGGVTITEMLDVRRKFRASRVLRLILSRGNGASLKQAGFSHQWHGAPPPPPSSPS